MITLIQSLDLRKRNSYSIGADYSYSLTTNASFNAWYEHSRNTNDQKGRQSSSSPSTSPDFDWTGGLEDIFDTVGVGYLMNFREGKCNWNTDLVYARANGKEDLTGGVAIRPTGAVGLPNVDDTDHVSLRDQCRDQNVSTSKICNWLLA